MALILVLVLLGVGLFARYVCGPLLVFELVRTARRRGIFLLRTGYVFLLLLILTLLYSAWFRPDWSNGGELAPGNQWAEGQIGEFTESFFSGFQVVQVLVVLFLTPTFVAGTIGEDRKQGTLELLLTSHVSAWQILLCKLFSRLALLVLLLLAGLPVLALLQLLGGVDPLLLLGTYLLLFITLFLVGSLAVLYAVVFRSGASAGLYACLGVVGYGMLTVACSCLGGLPQSGFSLMNSHAISPFLVWVQLVNYARNGSLERELPGLILTYASVSGLMSVLFLYVASSQLRVVIGSPPPPEEEPETVPRDQVSAARLRDTEPMTWKERIGESHVDVLNFPDLPAEGKNLDVASWLWVLSIFPVLFLIMGYLLFLFPMGLLALAFRSAGGVARERQRGTLEALILTELTPLTILRAKYVSCLWHVRVEGFILLVLLTMITVISPVTILFDLAIIVYAFFTTSLGIWFSVRHRSPMRARVMTMIVLILCLGGHQVITFLLPALLRGMLGASGALLLDEMLTWGFHLPGTLLTLTGREVLPRHLVAALSGLACYAFLAWVLWYWAKRRFIRNPLGTE